MTNQAAQVTQAFEKLRNTAERLAERTAATNDVEALHMLDRIWHRLEQGPVRLLVLGLTSAGKSTLINALAGEVVVPEGNTATSPLPVWLKQGSVNLDLFDRSAGSFPRREPMGLFAFITQFCYSALDNDSSQYANYSAAECCRETIHGDLQHVTVIDTPGLKASSGDDARAREAAELGCEMVLLMCAAENGTGALSDADGQYYRALFEELSLTLPDDLFVVGNVRDEVYSGLGAESGFEKVARTHFGKYAQLFRFDVRAARLMRAGAYRYGDLLPDQVKNDEERDNAGTLQAAELALYREAQSGSNPWGVDYADAVRQLDSLCAAIRSRAEALYADPQALIQPVQEQLRQVAERLMQQDVNDPALTLDDPAIRQLTVFADRLRQDHASAASRFAAMAQTARHLDGEGAATLLRSLKDFNTFYRVFGEESQAQADADMVTAMLSDDWDSLHQQYAQRYQTYVLAKHESLFSDGSPACQLHSGLLEQTSRMSALLDEYTRAYTALSAENKDADSFQQAISAVREELTTLRTMEKTSFHTARESALTAFDVPAFDDFIAKALAARRPNLVKRRFGSKFFLYPSVANDARSFFDKQADLAVQRLNALYFSRMAGALTVQPLLDALAQLQEHIAQLSGAIHRQLIHSQYDQLLRETERPL